MKTAIIQPTNPLRRIVMYTRQFSDQIEVQTFDEIVKDKKIEILLSERNGLNAQDIILLRQKFPHHKIMLLAEEEDSFFQKACITHDILLIYNSMSEREKLDTIQKTWFGLEEQTEYHNVVAIHGTHRQVGVTQVALSLGYELGNLNYKTIVIGLNPYNPGEIPKVNATYSFEQIYDLIENDVIHDAESLLPYLTKVGSFYYLLGNRDKYKAMTFESKPVERLIHFVKDYFHIVLLDIGSFYDSYLPLTGLQLSNTHVLISSQESIAMTEYKSWQEQVLNRFEFHPKSVYQVVNKVSSRAIITPSLLRDSFNTQILAEIPYFPEANDSIMEDGILAQADYRPYSKVIEGLARAIAEEATEGNEEKRSGFFKFFGSKKGAQAL